MQVHGKPGSSDQGTAQWTGQSPPCWMVLPQPGAGQPEAAPALRREAGRRRAAQEPGQASGSAAGSITVNVLPAPGALSTTMVPLCSSMILWVIARPRPVPFALVV